MAKHLVDLDESALQLARAALGTTTMKDTVNEALRLAGENHHHKISAAIATLSKANLDDREHAWR